MIGAQRIAKHISTMLSITYNFENIDTKINILPANPNTSSVYIPRYLTSNGSGHRG